MMAASPRILSLLPSATEIAVALGLRDNLVGRSHECDFPSDVTKLPVCTATKLEKGLTSRQIDDRVQEIVRQGLSVYEVDDKLLRQLAPDIILTQSQCAVCAVTPADLDEALARWVGRWPVMLSLAPDDLGDVWSDIRRVGEAAGCASRAEKLVTDLTSQLAEISINRSAAETRPTVAAIEWLDPLMAAGNWIPELVEIAGGRNLFTVAGQHSPWLDWDDLIGADPEIIVVMPCGYQLAQTEPELEKLAEDPRWQGLTAVRNGRVYAVDGHHLFNRPGPRLVESAEVLAEVFASRR